MVNASKAPSNMAGRTFFISHRFVLVDLNLDTLLRLKLRNLNTAQNLLEQVRIAVTLETVVEGVKIGCGDDVFEVLWLEAESILAISRDEQIASSALTISASNLIASGARLGPDQNG